jgi:hypothetical protein
MEKQDLSHTKIVAESDARIAALEAELAAKEAALFEKESIIKKLTQDVDYLAFQNDQMRRLIFGSKRERFIPQAHPGQFTINFEPHIAEIEASVKAEREKIRIEYERKKTKKDHPGRLQLPSHLPVNEIIMEPVEDTSGMTCIGQEITEELDYTPAKLHINVSVLLTPSFIASYDFLDLKHEKIPTTHSGRDVRPCKGLH